MITSTIKRASWVTIALLGLLLSCKKSTDVATPATQECQLQSELTVNNNISQQATSYTYNQDGQLIKSITSSSGGTSVTYTYSYDATGNVVTALTQGTVANTSFNSTGSYAYTNGRLTQLISKSSSSVFASTTDSYTYDGSGQIASYSYTSSDPIYGTESYTFTNGQLTAGTVTKSGQPVAVGIKDNRIASLTYPDGRSERYTYDANNYVTRRESVDKAGTLQFYTVYEYRTTSYKRAPTPYRVVPNLKLYGNTDLPNSRVATYNADGSLKDETRYQYQVNSKGYITSQSYTQNQSGVGGQGSSTTTYTYNNCQ